MLTSLSSLSSGYIGEFEVVDNRRSGKIVIELNGRLNKCGVISPRYDFAADEVESWVSRLLPSRQFGYFVVTTSSGIFDHEEARRKKVGRQDPRLLLLKTAKALPLPQPLKAPLL